VRKNRRADQSLTEASAAICDRDTPDSARAAVRLARSSTPRDSVERMTLGSKKSHLDEKPQFGGRNGHVGSRRIVVVTVPPIDELDLVGPLQVFRSVNRLVGRDVYAIEVVTSATGLEVEGERGGLTFVARHHFKKVAGECESVLVVCGLASRSVRDAALSAWLRKMAGEVRRLGAVCVGSFLLAEAGLLNGRRATSHWKFGSEFAARYPKVLVEHEPLWVKDGNIYTSAGISASIDLALAWVEEDCGAGVAHEAARELVLFLRRPGGQPQVSISLASQASEMASIRELQIWIAEHLEMKLSVEGLAERMAMSGRNFERVFTREVGTTPSQYVL